MNYTDAACAFACDEATLVGVAALPEAPSSVGVVLIVGGPQYRVGSHRQFVLLARRLAEGGFAVLRFDYHGRGDSSGTRRDFESADADIRAAIDELQRLCPAVREVVLWGLCDAASAAMMYAPSDQRVRGLALLNPWARSDATIAKTHIKHYYRARLTHPEFWKKMASGKLDVRNAAKSLAGNLRAALSSRSNGAEPTAPFQTRMARGLARFRGRVLLLISGNDLTAKEFLEYVKTDREWADLLDAPKVSRHDFPGADHTFSTRADRRAVEDATLAWLEDLAARDGRGR